MDEPEQLTLFNTHIDYTLRLSTPLRTEDWPLPAAATLEEAADAAHGFAVFLMFSQGVLWDGSFDNPESYQFGGFDQQGNPVRLEVTMQDSYTDHNGNRL
jgi:hypothetical protein